MEEPADRIDSILYLNKVDEISKIKNCSKQTLKVKINGIEIEMELDMVASCGIVTSETLNSIGLRLQQTEDS